VVEAAASGAGGVVGAGGVLLVGGGPADVVLGLPGLPKPSRGRRREAGANIA
jgi:hypothetical protein